MDLRSEIAARKQRIAELRRQRESHPLASNLVRPEEPLTLNVPKSVHISVPEPFVYERETQTDSLVISATSFANTDIGGEEVASEELDNLLVDEKAHDSLTNESPSDQSGCLPTFKYTPIDHLSPQLCSFIDDFYRNLAHENLRNYRKTPPKAAPLPTGADEFALELVAELTGNSRLSFSPFHPLIAALDQSKRRVYISEYVPDLPKDSATEFTLRSPTQLSDVKFSPLMAQYVFGSGKNGQILMWDLKSLRCQGGRYELLPQMRSPIDGNAIVALRLLGSVSLVSIDSEAVVKVWAADRLSRPIHTFSLEDTLRSSMTQLRISALVPTCFEVFSPREHGFALGFGWKVGLVGCLSGHILRMPNSLTSSAHTELGQHAAPVSCLALDYQVHGPRANVGEQYVRLVSGGLDWYLRVWRVPLEEHIPASEERSIKIDFAVSTVAFSTRDTQLFAAAGENVVQLWHLSRALPLLTIETTHTVSQLQFDRDYLAVATTTEVLVYKYPQLSERQG